MASLTFEKCEDVCNILEESVAEVNVFILVNENAYWAHFIEFVVESIATGSLRQVEFGLSSLGSSL